MQSSNTDNDNTTNPNQEELHILQSIISRLYACCLITDTEKKNLDTKISSLEIKGEIYNLLHRKDTFTSAKILQTVRVLNGVENSSDEQKDWNPLEIAHKNPMQIDMIIKILFGFLNLQDLKNSRQVSKKWNDIAEPIMRKRSKIVFRRSSLIHSKNSNPEDFVETFCNCGTNIPFTSYSFSSWDGQNGWNISEITQFFEQHRKDVEELELHNLVLMDENNERVEDYNLTSWISGSPIKKLIIDCFESFHSPDLIVSLNQLQQLKRLRLRNCNVNVQEESRISPEEIELEYVMFHHAGRELDPCHINNYIDFSKANSVLIHCSEEESTVILDLKDWTNVNELDLKECTLVNWGTSKCKLNRLDLIDIPILEKTEMQIKELHIKSSSVDIVALPSQIEKLNFNCSDDIAILCTQPVALPNLKLLYFYNSRNLVVLSYFINCINLVDIHIEYPNERTEPLTHLNLTWIPQSVKRLKLGGEVRLQNSETELHLETLVLERWSFLNGVTILAKIKPKVLVMTWNPGYEVNDAAAIFRHQFSTLEKFFVGPFRWYKNSFSKSLLAMYVDREANYYVFENQRGRSIDHTEFSEMDFSLE